MIISVVYSHINTYALHKYSVCNFISCSSATLRKNRVAMVTLKELLVLKLVIPALLHE